MQEKTDPLNAEVHPRSHRHGLFVGVVVPVVSVIPFQSEMRSEVIIECRTCAVGYGVKVYRDGIVKRLTCGGHICSRVKPLVPDENLHLRCGIVLRESAGRQQDRYKKCGER